MIGPGHVPRTDHGYGVALMALWVYAKNITERDEKPMNCSTCKQTPAGSQCSLCGEPVGAKITFANVGGGVKRNRETGIKIHNLHNGEWVLYSRQADGTLGYWGFETNAAYALSEAVERVQMFREDVVAAHAEALEMNARVSA
jgi:hypothetical protein